MPASDASSEKTLERDDSTPEPKSQLEPQQPVGPTIMQDEERFRGSVSWRSMYRSNPSVSFTDVDILHSMPRLSGHSSYKNAPPLLRNSLNQGASVDYPTERTIQTTLRDPFLTRTVHCIVHRLRTIFACNRICVCDDGKVAKSDTLLNLFAKTDRESTKRRFGMLSWV